MGRERRQVVGQAGRGTWILAAELADEGPQGRLSLRWRRGLIERRPVGGPDAVMETGPFGQLGQDIPKAMHRTSLAIGIGPQLAHRSDQPGRSVADHEQRAAQTAADETLAEVEPVGDPLTLAEADIEQDPLAVDGVAPGDEDALLGAVAPDRQVDRVEQEREEPDLGQAPGPEGTVAIAQLAADRGYRRLADLTEAGLPRQALDVRRGTALARRRR